MSQALLKEEIWGEFLNEFESLELRVSKLEAEAKELTGNLMSITASAKYNKTGYSASIIRRG